MTEKTMQGSGKAENVTGRVRTAREAERTLAPAVDIFEMEDALVVVADLPGVGKDSVDINVDENVLTIRGTADAPQRGEPVVREFELIKYFRQFELGELTDRDRIRAEMKYGVLTVHLPKAEQAKPRRIPVTTAQE